MSARRLLLSPLLLLVALAAVLTGGTVFASGGHASETRVRALDTPTANAVGQHSSETAGSVGCLRPAQPAIASGSCVATEAGSPGEFVDPAARRVTLRQGTKAEIQANAPRTATGDFIDPNTGQVIPQEGPFDYGHTPGNEWWRTQQMAREEGWTRQQVIDYENDPSHYQIENPGSNRSHRFEEPR